LGGTAVLTEVPEMFGAETILMDRAADINVFNGVVNMINDFKDYYAFYGQPIYENPSPGNKDGGISTLEEKSAGCVMKAGNGEITDVLFYGERAIKNGVNLLEGPGNDLVSVTALAAAGCQIILFTTGRGTPAGACVPTVKISSNTGLYEHKKNWIDFDAGALTGGGMDGLSDGLFRYIKDVASGFKTKNEIHGQRETAIFKNGVTL